MHTLASSRLVGHMELRRGEREREREREREERRTINNFTTKLLGSMSIIIIYKNFFFFPVSISIFQFDKLSSSLTSSKVGSMSAPQSYPSQEIPRVFGQGVRSRPKVNEVHSLVSTNVVLRFGSASTLHEQPMDKFKAKVAAFSLEYRCYEHHNRLS